jgi:hypothetical protein
MIKMNQEYLEFVKTLRPIDDIFMKVIFNDQHCMLNAKLNKKKNKENSQNKRKSLIKVNE